ncbi:CoA transferase [Methylibium rhizosphaerae]|uniref:CoA transferase n=1 Tax=Methylibium rhizosphaerae TaxID=2570323 RepID=UPI00112CB4C9|nr:CoA transferase [Methylibium rhizosphaerae]
MTALAALRELWLGQGGEARALEAVELTGLGPVLPSSFAVGTAAQACIAATTLAAREIGRARGGPEQRVRVDMRHAEIEFRSERYLQVNGAPAPDPWDRIAGIYRTADGWVRLHTNFAHHRDGVLRLLGCANERAAVAATLEGWKAGDFETAAAEAGLVVTALRSFEQWDAHPQGRAVAALPVLEIERIGEAPVPKWPALPAGARPLHGLRVLDLTRVIAGPVCGRALAAQGADVMLVTSPRLPSIASLVIDTGRGKRSAQLDLRDAQGREALAALVRGTDVFVQGYRPGGLAALGFSPPELARLRPGIVCASLSAYGHVGPWAGRRGFDSLVQTASGFNVAEAQAAGVAEPRPLPAQALDHGTGYLLALAVQLALLRRAREGGSWHVRVSLAQTGHWLRSLGRLPDGPAAADPTLADVLDLMEHSDSGFGRLQAVRHSGRLDVTPPGWDRPAVPLGTHAARWS